MALELSPDALMRAPPLASFAGVLEELMSPCSEIEPAALALVNAMDFERRSEAMLSMCTLIGARFAAHRHLFAA